MTNLSILSNNIRLHNGLYSLNDLHKAAGNQKRNEPNRFLRLEQTRSLQVEIESYPDLGSAVNVISNHKNRGTWVCKELVYAYAMWISPKFHLQVIRAFDAQQQLAITKLPAPLDYQRIILTIENGQTTHTQALALEDMVTSFDKIPGILRESMKIQPYQLAQIAKAANERLSRMIHKR